MGNDSCLILALRSENSGQHSVIDYVLSTYCLLLAHSAARYRNITNEWYGILINFLSGPYVLLFPPFSPSGERRCSPVEPVKCFYGKRVHREAVCTLTKDRHCDRLASVDCTSPLLNAPSFPVAISPPVSSFLLHARESARSRC